MDILREAILLPGAPDDFAFKTVQQVIKPQRPTKLAQDESQLLENMLRRLLQELVTSAMKTGEPTMSYGRSIDDEENTNGQIPRLLDIVLFLCEREHVEGGMIFQLLEDLTEMSTLRNCKDIFGYIERKQDILGKQELFARGKLVMLRTCNQLLRRLSKANEVVFCGRILMFLAHFFPLSERSAVNIKGVFNTSNETKYEKDPPEGISVDFNFYKTLWSLQEHFCDPSSLSSAQNKWQRFTQILTVVLSTFEAQPLSEEEGDANNLDEEVTSFNTKYLTSSKLMGLELKDPSFRRNILVQCLIMFDYLKAPGKNDKEMTSEMKEELGSFEVRVGKLLEVTPPKGNEFLDKVGHILEREKNWVWWKRDSCPPFEKPLAEKKSAQELSKKRKVRWRLGNKELSQLWKWADQNPNALTDPHRVRTPSINDYWKPLAEDVSTTSLFFALILLSTQMDPSAGIEAEYHHKNNRVYCWKGLRLSARQDLDGFSRFSEFGVEGVVPLEILPAEALSKYQAKPNEKSKRVKKEDVKGPSSQPPAEPHGDVEGMVTTNEAVDCNNNIGHVVASPEDDHKQSPIPEMGQIEDSSMDPETDADADADLDNIP